MRVLRLVGIVLIVLGVLGLVFPEGIPYATERETVQLGPIEAKAEQEKSVTIPPLLAGLAIVGGVVLFFAGRSRRT